MMNKNSGPFRYRSAAQGLVRKLEERIRVLKEICTHDSLTGLLTAEHFKEQVLERINNRFDNKRSGDMCHMNGPVVIVFIDLDRFKEVNDTLGHAAGDETLQILAGIILGRIVRDADLVCRRSGDEFFIALFDIDKDGADRRLVEMRKQFEAALQSKFPDYLFLASFSFGSVELPAVNMNRGRLETFLRVAEEEMYENKQERAKKLQGYQV